MDVVEINRALLNAFGFTGEDNIISLKLEYHNHMMPTVTIKRTVNADEAGKLKDLHSLFELKLKTEREIKCGQPSL